MSRIIVALDYHDLKPMQELVAQLTPQQCALKIGSVMFTQFGPGLVETLQAKGFDVFLDLKYHDIPATVASAVSFAAELGVWMVNVHCLGGRVMLSAAVNALDERGAGQHRPLLIGVTMLTSMSDIELQAIGLHGNAEQQVNLLASMAKGSGLDGVVCSAREAESLKMRFGTSFKLVTPGIRLPGGDSHDQTRVTSPVAAAKAGSDFLVIGRAITRADEPASVLQAIFDSLNE